MNQDVHFRNILLRLESMGWLAINKKAGEAPEFLDLIWRSFTPVGKVRMKEITDIFIDAFPQFAFAKDLSHIKPEHFKNPSGIFREYLARMKSFCADLPPPPLCDAELDAFLGIVIWYTKMSLNPMTQ
ncbi:MAG TPA: hypothetical protein VMH87_00660 [Pseudomonadales bacterium]|nr:hypothetical protein [Pseudomonadales bacterium]